MTKTVRAYEALPDGTKKELVVGIEHIDDPENCHLLFNYAGQYIKPTERVLGKEIRIIFEP